MNHYKAVCCHCGSENIQARAQVVEYWKVTVDSGGRLLNWIEKVDEDNGSLDQVDYDPWWCPDCEAVETTANPGEQIQAGLGE